MKVGIDGFNLGLRQGTGIATYARELSKLLTANGHEVATLYGIDNVSNRNPDLAWSIFIQQLVTVGESGRGEIRRWGPRALVYAAKHLLCLPLQAQEIERRAEVMTLPVVEKLSAGARFLNIPSVFRASQAISLMSSRPLEVRLPVSVKCDLFHFTCPLPLKILGVPNVVTAHDIIPLILPHSTEVNLRHYKRLTETSFAAADLILTASDHSRRDILSSYNVPEEKLMTVHQAVDIPKKYRDLGSSEVSQFLFRNYGLQSGKYILFYGAIEPKKNVSRILDAIATVRGDVSLVVVGRNGWLNDDVELHLKQLEKIQQSATKKQSRQGGKVYRFDYVSFRSLMFIIKGARALVFPSLYEGFGLPLLEAMVMGCPVITSKVSSLPEVGGDAVIYVDPLDVNEIAAAIDAVATDNALHARLSNLGLKQAEKFSPAVHMGKLEKAYATVLKKV